MTKHTPACASLLSDQRFCHDTLKRILAKHAISKKACGQDQNFTCLKGSLKEDQTLGFKTNYQLMQVKNIAECLKGSILQYF